MASKNRQGKQTAEPSIPQNDEEGDLEMSEEEMYRIIRETGVLGGAQHVDAATSKQFVNMRPSQLNDDSITTPLARFTEVEDDDAEDEEENVHQSSMPSAFNVTTATAPRKLVELIDQDEALAQPDLLVRKPAEGSITAVLEEDESFRITLWIVVFSTLWLCMDLMIHAQYGQDRGFRDELGRALNVLPALAFVIYLTSRNPESYFTKAFLLGWSALGGSYMIHVVNNASYTDVMRRCPVLGTLWIWSIVQLDLASAILSLAAVAGYVKYKDLRIIFPS